jgi:hypothetical protein
LLPLACVYDAGIYGIDCCDDPPCVFEEHTRIVY